MGPIETSGACFESICHRSVVRGGQGQRRYLGTWKTGRRYVCLVKSKHAASVFCHTSVVCATLPALSFYGCVTMETRCRGAGIGQSGGAKPFSICHSLCIFYALLIQSMFTYMQFSNQIDRFVKLHRKGPGNQMKF